MNFRPLAHPRRVFPLLAVILPAFAGLLLLSACQSTSGKGGTASTVTRSSCMAIAERYRTHRWMPSERNVRHGLDPDGIRVDTPDTGYRVPGAFAGWWTPGQWNEGMPYQWGGFATPEQFDREIAQGFAAGDVYTAEKRRLLDAAVSRHATGIDCSGFISRCWGLSRSYSTRELQGICETISWEALQPGDVLNTWNAHVMLFAGWADAGRTRLVLYEAGYPPHWLVIRREARVADLQSVGFTPLRYRGMREG